MNEKLERFANIALVLCAIAIAFVFLNREFGSTSESASPAGPRRTKKWSDLLVRASTRMDTTATVRVVEFVDMQCPFCATFQGVLHRIERKYGSAVSIGVLHLPLSIHPQAYAAARAAECARPHGVFPAIVDTLLARQSILGSVPWDTLASRAGVKQVSEYRNCLLGAAVDSIIAADTLAATQVGARGTPSVFVDGWEFSAPPTEQALDSIVQATLQAHKVR